MWLLHGAVVRFYAHGTSRRSNPPSRASREQPVATLLLTSLRLLPPLSLHPDSRLVRIVAYGVAALVGATPSGSTGIPFHSVQPFNDAPDCLSNPRQMRTRRLQINDTNFSRMLLFSHSSLLSSPLKTFKLQVCSFHFPDNTVRETGIKRQTNERAGAAARAREEPSPAFAKERTQNAPVSSFPGVPVCNCVQAFHSPDRSPRRYTDQNVPNYLQAPEGPTLNFANKLQIL
ncbi:hypothetical protein ALC60_11013 [Trachymyrmex zeteki]|uniref:Uncharacterized protein n=1 Tax=Mycetomoellerius zeteki TaxID=64791 RepID=A0A151WPV6_9HYME|nr:hypothetical protein ALC60_11013 [Trachymyrmex zeteki]